MNFHHILPLFVAPLFLFFFIFYLKFKFKIHNYKNILLALVLGLFSSLLLIFSFKLYAISDFDQIGKTQHNIFFAFVIIAFISELGKFLVLFYGFFKKKNFGGPVESIIYSLFISIGFTISSSILYVTGFINPIDNILFLYLYGISNLIFAILLGFFVGLGKSRQNVLIDSITGLLTATFFHGLLIFCILTRNYSFLLIVLFVSIILSGILIVKSLNYKPTTNI